MAKITVEFDVPDAAAMGFVASLGGAAVAATSAPKAAAPAAPAPAAPAAPKAPPPPKAAPAAPKAPPAPAAPKAPPAAPAGPSPEDAAADEQAIADGWTLEHAQNQAKLYAETHGAAALGPILAEHGLKKVKDSSPRQWPVLFAAFGGGA